MNAQPAVLSVAMLAVFALGSGGAWLVARRGDRKRALLMLAAAGVLLLNVLLWAWPPPARAAAPLPPEVRSYAARAGACRRPQGGGAGPSFTDPRRACRALAEERRRLRLRYRGDPGVLEALRLEQGGRAPLR